MRIKSIELEAERIEQLMLWEALSGDEPAGKGSSKEAWTNLKAYMSAIGVHPDVADQTQMETLLKAGAALRI